MYCNFFAEAEPRKENGIKKLDSNNIIGSNDNVNKDLNMNEKLTSYLEFFSEYKTSSLRNYVGRQLFAVFCTNHYLNHRRITWMVCYTWQNNAELDQVQPLYFAFSIALFVLYNLTYARFRLLNQIQPQIERVYHRRAWVAKPHFDILMFLKFSFSCQVTYMWDGVLRG